MVTVIRLALAGAALAAASATLIPAAAAAAQFDNVTVTIGTFGGPWSDRLNVELKSKMAAAGITVKYVTALNEEIKAQLIAARGQKPPYDLVEISDATYPDLIAGKFLVPLDLEKIPNIKNLHPAMYNEYRVAYWASQPCLIYNVDKLAEAGIKPPVRYTDMADPRLAGRVLLSDITGYAGYYQVLSLAYENGGSEANPQKGFDMMAKIKPHSYSRSVAQTMQLFKSGDVWASINIAHIGMRMFDAGINVAVVHPEVDGHPVALARGYLGRASGSDDKGGALEFIINELVSAEVQESLYLWGATIPTNDIAMRKVQSTVKTDRAGHPFLQMDPATIAKSWVPDLGKVDRRAWVRSWQRAVAQQ
ncbi:MAG: extracellular solute-binding protein [Alphaproteobacteria bacterium]|nr:extracellular solute-binding protein [Alphaproteobacteria bacterium]